MEDEVLRKIEPKSRPSVSVIVPARNEELNIAKILTALESQTYKNLEIIVVNDNSTDCTKQIVQKFARVKLVDLPTEPPNGWVGKSWACWNGYLNSSGEILMFMDADVEPSPHAVESLVALYLEHGGLVSVWPHQRFEKFYEHLSLAFNMIVIGSMGSFSIFKTKPMGAYGPVVVVGRREYEDTQGHAALKDGVLEDIKLGKLFLKKVYPVTNYLGGELIKFRMYPQGFKELFKGFAKNMALGGHPWVQLSSWYSFGCSASTWRWVISSFFLTRSIICRSSFNSICSRRERAITPSLMHSCTLCTICFSFLSFSSRSTE